MSDIPAPAAHGYTAEQLASLTVAEREGLLDTSITDDYIPTEQEEAGLASPDDDGTADPADTYDEANDEDIVDDFLEGDNEDEALANIAKANQQALTKPQDDATIAKQTATTTAPAATLAEDETALAALPAPLIVPSIVEITAKVAAAEKLVTDFDTQIDELERKFDDGELDLREAEFKVQLAKLRADQRAALKDAAKMENAVETAKEQLNASLEQWQAKLVPDFMADKPEVFKNPNSIPFQIMNSHVKRLQTETGVQFDVRHLHKAYVAAMKEMETDGLVPPGGFKSTAKPETKAAEKPATESAKTRPAPPPNLGRIPASDIEDTTGLDPVFANLNKLAMTKPQLYEKELRRLSPDRRYEYLAL